MNMTNALNTSQKLTLMLKHLLTRPALDNFVYIMVLAALTDSPIRPPEPRDMSVSSQALAEVRHLLVTTENPESSTSENLDFERCSALHNAIVKHGWVASGRDIADLQEVYEWPPADESFLPKAQERLHSDVIELLKRCIDPGVEGGHFFRFLAGMPKDEAWWKWTEDCDEDWIQLYMASLDTSETGVAVMWVTILRKLWVHLLTSIATTNPTTASNTSGTATMGVSWSPLQSGSALRLCFRPGWISSNAARSLL